MNFDSYSFWFGYFVAMATAGFWLAIWKWNDR